MIRIATAADIDDIVAFTTDTFDWGDYVPDLISGWIDDTDGCVMVKTNDEDRVIALARAVFLTPTEMWSHAARVHPDYRGKGIAGELAVELMAWGAEHGGQVVRLLIEDDNLSSINHIMKLGFRRGVSVVRATRAVGAASPNPEGNGGRRTRSALQARPGKSQDIGLVRTSWSTSEVGRAMRELIGVGWFFHRLSDADIEGAARDGGLWEIGGSWAITTSIEPIFAVGLLDSPEDDAYDVIRALIDTANNRGAESVALWLADTVWLVQAARRAGCEVSGFGVWEHPLTPTT